MNILIVTSHPSSQGFAHKVAKHYQKGAEKAGHAVEVLDLYQDEFRQDFLKFEKLKEMVPSKGVKEIQERILWANELVFVFPMWWFSMPAILKNFFDQNFSSGFAYKYELTPGKGRARLRRLLKGKTARVFITANAPAWFFRLIMTPTVSLRWGTLFFCGIWTKSWTIFGKMRLANERQREKWLKKAERLGGKL